MATLRWLLPSLLLLATFKTSATSQPPALADYAVREKAPAWVASPVLASAQDRAYRSSLRAAAADGKVNFAGHYLLSAIGCGAGCIKVFLVDARDGHVYWLPFTLSDWPPDRSQKDFPPLDFQPDSRLLVIYGSRDEHGRGTYYYAFSDGHFRLLGTADAMQAPHTKT